MNHGMEEEDARQVNDGGKGGKQPINKWLKRKEVQPINQDT